jgi:hypothetical protein
MACGKTMGHGECCVVGRECSQCKALKGELNINTIKIPCGKITGHGESCVKGRLCDSCSKILKMKIRLSIS